MFLPFHYKLWKYNQDTISLSLFLSLSLSLSLTHSLTHSLTRALTVGFLKLLLYVSYMMFMLYVLFIPLHIARRVYITAK